MALAQESQPVVTPTTDETIQPEIGGDEGQFSGNDADEEDEEKELMEDKLRRLQKFDSVATIAKLRMKPERHSRLQIPLCRLVSMPMVRPTLSSDITKLENEFVHGYREGAAVFYVSVTNEAREKSHFMDEEMNSWNSLWKASNDEFNEYVQSVPELQFMKNMKFFICDGNHRHIAWMNFISRKYSADPNWHYKIDCIILKTKGRIELVMQTMHDINK